MTDNEIIEGETTEGEVQPYESDDPAGGVPMHGLAATPQIKATDLVQRLGTIKEAMHTAMQKEIDYGVVPGTDKPTLLKPGAEKLGVLFQLDIQIENEKMWGPGDHLTVLSRATAYHAPTGTRLGYGEGVCTTREKKYAYRKQERACPQCGANAIIQGKAEYGGGWLCWKKKGGCGAKFPSGSADIENQPQGEAENPDIPDCWNTVVKMAEKRARVDCILAVTGASALFTQDVEDMPGFQPPTEEDRSQEPSEAAQPSNSQTKGNGQGPSESKPQKATAAPQTRTEPLTESEVAHVRQLMHDTETDEQDFLGYCVQRLQQWSGEEYEIPSAEYIPPTFYDWACDLLKKKAKKKFEHDDQTIEQKAQEANVNEWAQ